MAAEGGVITFITALDNDQLEQDLNEAQKKVDEVKKKIEENDGKKSAIEQQMDQASLAVDATKQHVEELKQKLVELENTAPEDMNAWHSAQAQIREIKAEIDECNASIETQTAEIDKLDSQWQKLDGAAEQYAFELEGATSRATGLAEQVSSGYYQAGEKVRTTFESMSTSVANFGNRIGNLIQRTFVFSVFTSFLRDLKKGISEALDQNDAFSASWEYLSATMQGFANGIANVIAPALITVINAVTSCIMMLAKTIDTVFQTGLVSAIGAARKTAEQSWRQTDESKKAQKEADSIAKKKANQDKKYAQAQEKYAKQEQKAAERLADAQEKAAKRQAKAEAKYPEAVEKAAKRQTKAENKMAERLADKEEDTEKRRTKAEEKAAERLAKAEERAAERTAKAQDTYDKKVARAAEKAQKAQESYDKRVAKAAEKAQKAQEKANQSILGFDEITKINEESTTEDYLSAIEDYNDAIEEIAPPETYEVDPSDYVIDPDDYAINYDDYKIDPSDFFVDPEDYTFDPMDYWVDLDDYKLDPFSFDWEDFATVDPTASMRPSWDALDTGKITDQIAALEAVLSAALLAVGAILAFSGINIPLGLALMAAGAIGLADLVAENWDKLPAEVQNAITGTIVITGVVLIALGAVLAFSGVNVPLGIGLMAGGLALEWAAVALNWESMSPEMQGAVSVLMGILSGALLVVGAVLAFSGANVPLGIALMILGAMSLATVVALNWNSMTPEIQGAISAIAAIVGVAFLVLGAVFAFSGTHIALGIALMVLGAASLATVTALNWEFISQHISEVIGVIETAVGTAFLCVGAVLAFSGANPPLGIALMAVGAVSLGKAIIENWDKLPDDVKGVIATIEYALGVAFLCVGAILCFSGANTPLGIALLVTGAAAMGHALTENWGKLPSNVKGVIAEIEAALSVAFLCIGGMLAFSGANIPLGIALLVTGAASLAHLITLNWDELPEDVKNTVSRILLIASEALLVLGIIILFASGGTAAGLALGLIIAGAVGLAAEVAINWDFIKEKCGEIWEGVKQWWENGPAQIFTIEWWENLFQCIPNAIVNAINSVTEVFNSWFEGVQDCLAQVVGASGGTYTYSSPVPSVRPPGLARGAVIPPNREFMAVLGDQTSGNNIETPEQLMRDVVRQEAGSIMAEMMLQMQAMQSDSGDSGDFIVPIIIDSEELARAVFKGQGRASRRGVIGAELSFA